PHSPHFSSNTHVHHTYLHPFPTRRSSDLHHGANQPVKDLSSGKVAITAQNHGFAVDPKSLPSDVEVTHINLNDGTVEGMRYKELPIFSVQYHPEAAPGPHDASYFFDQFADLIEKSV